MYKFTVLDLSNNIFWILKYTPTNEPQFETIVGDSHIWLWDMFAGSLTKDGSTDLIDGGWGITIERWQDPT